MSVEGYGTCVVGEEITSNSASTKDEAGYYHEPNNHPELWQIVKGGTNAEGARGYETEEEEALLERRRIKLRTVSMEFFNPPAESHLRRSNLFAATFNMVATIIGGGILSIPLSLQKTGLILGTILMIVAAITTAFSLYILCSCSRRSGASSYGGVARVAFGPGLELFTTLLLFVFLIFVIIGYMVLVKNIWTPIVIALMQNIHLESDENAINVKQLENIVLLVIIVLVSPFLLKQDLHALRHNCYVGFVSTAILSAAILYRAYERNVIEDPNLFQSNVLWFTNSFADALFAYPIITLAFLCSFNVISVHGALVNPTRERVQQLINYAVFASFGMTYLFGLAGYLYAYNDTQGNILLNFDASDRLIFTGRMGCGITLMLAMPMIMVPCRDSLFTLPLQYRAWKHVSKHHNGHNDTVIATEEEEAASLLNEPTKQGTHNETHHVHLDNNRTMSAKQTVIHVITTFIIVSVAYLGATKAPSVALVWSICGSSMAFIIAFILPAACYIKLRHERKGHTHRILVASWVLLILSVIGAIACTVQTFWRIFLAD